MTTALILFDFSNCEKLRHLDLKSTRMFYFSFELANISQFGIWICFHINSLARQGLLGVTSEAPTVIGLFSTIDSSRAFPATFSQQFLNLSVRE